MTFKIVIKQKNLILRNSIKAILKLWKSKEYIKDFEEYKERNTFKGIEIIY